MNRTATIRHRRRAQACLLAASAFFLASLAAAVPQPAEPETRRVPRLGLTIAAQGNAALHALKQAAREAPRAPAWPRGLQAETTALAAAP